MYGILTLTLILWQQAVCIRIVDLQVPGHAAEGGSALLGCQYDLEGEELYSVKWYKDGQEFYRYVPSNTETISYFPMTGVMVDISRSSSTVVALEGLRQESAGLYRCEVSGEAPYFVTAYDESTVNIHLLPKSGPQITGLQTEYRIGELLAVNCTSSRSRPRAQVSWQMNGRPAPKEYVRGPWIRQSRDRSDAHDTTLELSFVIAPDHFQENGLILQCQSSIAPLYQKDVIQQILRVPDVPIDDNEDLNTDLNVQLGQNFVIANHEPDEEMVTPVLPKSGPQITGLQTEYRIGELLAVNCTSSRSRPRAQVSWQMNGRPAPKEYVRGPWIRQSRDRSDAHDTTLELSFVIAPDHFQENGLILQCQSSIAPLYQKDVIQQILRVPDVPIDDNEDLNTDLNVQLGQNFVIANHEPDEEMVTPVLPKSGPQITGLQTEYRIGELLAVNCTSSRSRPRAQVSWQMNGRPAPKEYVRGPWIRQSRDRSDAHDTTLELSFVIAPDHFQENGLILQCQSSIAPLYQKDVIQQILRVPDVPIDDNEDLNTDLNVQLGQNFVIANHEPDEEMVTPDHSAVLKVPTWTLVMSVIFNFISKLFYYI